MEENIKYTQNEGSIKYIKKTEKQIKEDKRMNESNNETLCEACLLN
jgi:hypothetical protein